MKDLLNQYSIVTILSLNILVVVLKKKNNANKFFFFFLFFFRKRMQENCHKRIHDIENNVYESPRKKFILEENFAKDMAAMSLYSNDSKKYTENQRILSNKPPIVDQNKNVVRIDDINQFLAENQDKEDFMPIVVDHKIWVDDGDSGLPLEICPGDERPRVPSFVLRNSE
ncbi:unnamed protein product [Rhizopus stolonifer]